MILDFDYITMGQRIKQRRKELNMTQADLLSCWLSFIRINQTKNNLFMFFRTLFLS